jgi:general secretion pathway protein G
MHRTWSRGFTLVEILIVVLILGILAAIALPQFGQASSDARISGLKTDLQSVRGQIQTYKMQHDDYPDADFINQLTQHSDASGGTSAASDSTHVFGPYMDALPINPISNSRAMRVVTGASTVFTAPTSDGGWWYNSTTGEFRPDLKDTRVLSDGTKYNTF